MDDYERWRRVDRLEYDVDLLKAHRKECDADMEAHGKLLLNDENRMTNLESSVTRLDGTTKEGRDELWKKVNEHGESIRNLQNFQLQLITGGLVVGALFGFIIKLLWK